MNIAIVGAGIAGLTAARALCGYHQVTVFEAADRPGGHTHTLDVPAGGRSFAVDTGFIVFNERTYPRFIALLDELGVAWQPTVMTLSVSAAHTGIEYSGAGLGGVFAQPGNALRPAFWGLLRDIRRFGPALRAALPTLASDVTLADFARAHGFGPLLYDHYLLPMASAVWSCPSGQVREFPARFFGEFFDHHGLLTFRERPRWRVLCGGSRAYLEPLMAPFATRVRLRTPVVGITRTAAGVTVRTAHGDAARFDAVVLACHSDQALRMLTDPSDAERAVLGALPYARNEVVLHTDTAVLPRARRAWACWNYRVSGADQAAQVSYNMNLLQGLDAPETFCVTLNGAAGVDPRRVLARMVYHHPVYTTAGMRARARLADISGVRGTWYAGAYWGDGFHESGVVSGQQAAAALLGAARAAA